MQEVARTLVLDLAGKVAAQDVKINVADRVLVPVERLVEVIVAINAVTIVRQHALQTVKCIAVIVVGNIVGVLAIRIVEGLVHPLVQIIVLAGVIQVVMPGKCSS